MRDKSLDILLIALFGASGTAILILAWSQPMSAAERVLSTLVGLAGLLLAFIKTVQSKSAPVLAYRQAQVKVKPEDKPRRF